MKNGFSDTLRRGFWQEEMDLAGELLPWGCRTRDEELGWLPGASVLNSSGSQPCFPSPEAAQDLGSAHTQAENPSNTILRSAQPFHG